MVMYSCVKQTKECQSSKVKQIITEIKARLREYFHYSKQKDHNIKLTLFFGLNN